MEISSSRIRQDTKVKGLQIDGDVSVKNYAYDDDTILTILNPQNLIQ